MPFHDPASQAVDDAAADLESIPPCLLSFRCRSEQETVAGAAACALPARWRPQPTPPPPTPPAVVQVAEQQAEKWTREDRKKRAFRGYS